MNEDVVKEFSKKVCVLCWVMIVFKNLDKKVMVVKKIWGERCNKVIFFSSVINDLFLIVGLKVFEGCEYLIGKII